MRPLNAIGIVWIGWVVSWVLAALWTNPRVKRDQSREQRLVRLIIPIGAVLIALGSNGSDSLLGLPGWTCFAVMTGGLAFAWWGRAHLGRLWSATITRAQDHRLITSGPYALVRHPIYTGVIVAIAATAIVENRALALIGAAIIAFTFWYRAKLEERFLRQELGVEAYDDYARHVPMLIPFWPRKG